MTHERARVAVKNWGVDAMSFVAMETDMLHWFDDAGPDPTGGCVAYVDTGTAWVAATGPLCAARDVAKVSARFVDAARVAGRRACFFGTERGSIPGFSQVLLGQQPIFRPRTWIEQLPQRRSIREQLRRARAKGVTVRGVTTDEVAPGTPLRAELDALAREWLWSRPMDPMRFLVSLEPFVLPQVHLYLVAELEGRVVALLSAVPIYTRRGWLVEDLVRSSAAPNGTTELLLYGLMLQVEDSCDLITLGLTPLSGDVSRALRLAGAAGSSFFDFDGLLAFRRRLAPHHWQSVWMLHPRGTSGFAHLVDGLRAFAGGSLVRFGARSLFRHPGGPPRLLALPLVPWTLALVAMAVSGHAAWLGFRVEQLSAWSVFDVMMILLLFHVSARPRPLGLVVAVLVSLVDAMLSVSHLRSVGLGNGSVEETLRLVATAAPCVAVALLGWAWLRAMRTRRPAQSSPLLRRRPAGS